MENDPWGLPYKIMMRKVDGKPPGVEAKGREMMVTRELFPIPELTCWDAVPVVGRNGGAEPPALFTLAELTEAAKRLPSGNAPGPDGVSNEILKTLVKRDPESVLDFFNSRLQESNFPVRWKVRR